MMRTQAQDQLELVQMKDRELAQLVGKVISVEAELYTPP